ncbi:MAG: CHRD domain-containing protein [Deltaproteobacteria bacterium]|nr:MAG: CHRD domain-containing protein [Deltaproteobacteria bacterium]
MVAPREVAAEPGETFVATLVGDEETPPNTSAALAKASAGLNPDDTLSYSIKSTRFDTDFRVAHLHLGGPGVAGPIAFPLECNSQGTACGGTSRPLSGDEKALLLAGNTYFNMHTDEFPGGEIRGQVVASELVGPGQDAVMKSFTGAVKGVGTDGSNGTAQISITGRFQVNGPIDFRLSTSVFDDLLNEVGGAGELVRGPDAGPALPFPLALVRRDGDRREITYRGPADGSHPSCRLQVKARGRGVFDFTVNSTPVIRVNTVQPWECSSTGGVVRELKSLGGGSTTTTTVPGNSTTTTAPPPSTSTTTLAPPATTSTTTTLPPGVTSTTRPPSPTTSTTITPPPSTTTTTAAPPTTSTTMVLGGPNRAPRVDFRADPASGTAPLTVTFTNHSSDLDGDALASRWEFGDGTESTESDPSHTYTTAGQFTVVLVVTDARGLSSLAKRENVTVRGATVPSSGPPRADFRADPASGTAPLAVVFSNRSSGGGALTASWDFGAPPRSTRRVAASSTPPAHAAVRPWYRPRSEVPRTRRCRDGRHAPEC